MLRAAGTLGDEAAVVEVLREAVDVHADLEAVAAVDFVFALNAVRSPLEYEYVKKTQVFIYAYSKKMVLAGWCHRASRNAWTRSSRRGT